MSWAYSHSRGIRGIWGWLWFSCGVAHCGKELISVFQEFFASIDKTFIFAGGLQLAYTMFISNNRESFHL